MEARSKTSLRCFTLLCMFVVSLAAPENPTPTQNPAAPQNQTHEDLIHGQEKFKLPFKIPLKKLKCSKDCAVQCAATLINPKTYGTCFNFCMQICQSPDQTMENKMYGVQATAENPGTDTGTGSGSDCTRNCVRSMSKVMTTNAKLTRAKEPATPSKPSESDLKPYAEGYVDSCYMSCSMDEKVF